MFLDPMFIYYFYAIMGYRIYLNNKYAGLENRNSWFPMKKLSAVWWFLWLILVQVFGWIIEFTKLVRFSLGEPSRFKLASICSLDFVCFFSSLIPDKSSIICDLKSLNFLCKSDIWSFLAWKRNPFSPLIIKFSASSIILS